MLLLDTVRRCIMLLEIQLINDSDVSKLGAFVFLVFIAS